jgi:AcrR family transcriptional regulator
MMARVSKQHEIRRDEILDAAQRLIYSKGYERMTIQDILDDLQIAKGTFYHYFGSKQALLEALIERILDQAEAFLIPITGDPALPAAEKLQRFFMTLIQWKTATQKDLLLALLRVWYADDNVLVRQKSNTMATRRLGPLLMAIVRQGIDEGSFTTAYPDQVGAVILSLVHDLQYNLAGLLLAFDPQRDDLHAITGTVAAYTDALERVLGAAPGSVHLIDVDTLREWFSRPGDGA